MEERFKMRINTLLYDNDLGTLYEASRGGYPLSSEQSKYHTDFISRLLKMTKDHPWIKEYFSFSHYLPVSSVSKQLKFQESRKKQRATMVVVSGRGYSGDTKLDEEIGRLKEVLKKFKDEKEIPVGTETNWVLANFSDLREDIITIIDTTEEKKIEFKQTLEDYISNYMSRDLIGQSIYAKHDLYCKPLVDQILSEQYQEMYGIEKTPLYSDDKYFFTHSLLVLERQGVIKLLSVVYTYWKSVPINNRLKSGNYPVNHWLATINVLKKAEKSILVAPPSSSILTIRTVKKDDQLSYIFPFGDPLQFQEKAQDLQLFQKLLESIGKQVSGDQIGLDKNQISSARRQLQQKLVASKLYDFVHVFSKHNGGYWLVIMPPNLKIEVTST